eukprot:TRINITY_DN5966_c0_g1_i2.p1 TRINITY_DN5966_c0_g1~~TRINITY_DN5966_c0_g1_i2.p1  ORF type:complete len:510 (+),score=80.65 TRINITY_DN5966_c0_g1_i2:61-1590(+)
MENAKVALLAADDVDANSSHVLQTEIKQLFAIAWPTALAMLFRFAMSVTDTAVVGHLSTQYLAAAAVSQNYQWILYAFIPRGMEGALSALAAQSFGAGNYPLLGIWLQIHIAISSVLLIGVGIGYLFTEQALLGIGASADASYWGGVFSLYSIPGLLPATIFSAMNIYFQAQGDLKPMLVVNGIFFLVNVAVNVLLVYGIPPYWGGLGFIGSPIATLVSKVGEWLVYHFYMVTWKKRHLRTWPVEGWSFEHFTWQRIRTYLEIAVPLSFGAYLEELLLQVMMVMAARLGDTDAAAHNSMLNVFSFLTAFSTSVFNATTVRVSFHLGAGRPMMARLAAGTALKYMSIPVGVFTTVLFFLIRNYVGRMFSDDEAVVHLMSELSIIVGGSFLMLCFLYVTMAVLEAMSQTNAVAVSFLVGSWGVALPCAWLFGFHLHKGLFGIWLGLLLGYSVVSLLTGIAVLRVDWVQMSKAAMIRAEGNPNQIQEDVQPGQQLDESDRQSDTPMYSPAPY